MQEQQGEGMDCMGMMGRMRRRRRGMGRCPMCGRMMEEEQEEGEHRGKGPARRTDEQIKAEVEQELTEDSRLDASNVQVEV